MKHIGGNCKIEHRSKNNMRYMSNNINIWCKVWGRKIDII